MARASILRWALAGAIAVLLGTGLLKVFTGGLAGAASAPPAHPTPQVAATTVPWSATVLTTDRLITVTLEVDPNQSGPNSFTVKLVALGTGRALTHASISLFTTMLDMKMAPTSLVMHADGRGYFHGKGELLMGGDWDIHLLIRMADQSQNEAQIRLLTPI
jgi:hypothetical protein